MKTVIGVILAALMLAGCGTINTNSNINLKPIEIKPIHITIDINLKVDKALDNFFGDLDKTQPNKKPRGRQ